MLRQALFTDSDSLKSLVIFKDAGLAELADALGLEPSGETRGGSSPSSRTLCGKICESL